MSGTAGLSAAKNRRSGNEVKFNGQQKQLPQPQSCSQKGGQQQCGVQQQYGVQQNMPLQFNPQAPPHPLVLLKSHELRLQKLESIISSEPTTDVYYSQIEKDFADHKADYLLFKSVVQNNDRNVLSANVNVPSGNVNVPSTSTCACANVNTNDGAMQIQVKKISDLEGDILILHRRIDEMYKLIDSLTKEQTPVLTMQPVTVTEEQPPVTDLEEPNIQLEILEPLETTPL